MKTAPELWTELYPDRRPWSQLDESTQAEWIRFTVAAQQGLQPVITAALNICEWFDTGGKTTGEILTLNAALRTALIGLPGFPKI